jgi:hypothetical protein
MLLAELNPKKMTRSIELNGLSFDFYKQGLGSLKINYSKNLYDIFNIPESNNLTPALVHPRLKKLDYWSSNSHRITAFFGASALQFFTMYCLLKASEKTANEMNAGAILGAVISNDSLADIYKFGTIVLPKEAHEELKLQGYKVDCVQSLFAISFLNSIENKDLDQLSNSYFMRWIDKKIASAIENYSRLNKKNIISIAAERLQRLGFKYQFTSENSVSSVLIENIRTHKSYNFKGRFYEGSKKEKRIKLSSLILRLVDAWEGISLSHELKENIFESFIEFTNFLDSELISNRRMKAVDAGLELKALEPHLLTNYKDESFPSLLALWDDSSLSLGKRAEILCRLRLHVGLAKSFVEVADYIWIPIIYDDFYPHEGVKSVLDFDTNNDQKDGREVEEVQPVLIDEGTQNNDLFKSQIKTQTKTDANVIGAVGIKANVTARTETTALESQNKFSAMTLEELESLWRCRDRQFEFEEEAAMVLAEVRYKKGIDFIKHSYTAFTSTDIIKNLDLPSLKVATNDKQKVNLDNTLPKNKIGTFHKLQFDNGKDERTFKDRKIAIRSGQQQFRRELISKWDVCVISGSSVMSIVEAAHIAPYRGVKDNHHSNGLLLRVDLHRLFDNYYIGISPHDFKVHLAPNLIDSEYSIFEGWELKFQEKEISTSALLYRWHLFEEKAKEESNNV